jgi:Tfp pilus assembly protein PilZ
VIQAQLSDLGEGGAFVDTSNPLPVGTRLTYRFSLPADSEPVRGEARVVWEQPTVGMALEFIGLSAADHDRLRFFVASEFFGG